MKSLGSICAGIGLISLSCVAQPNSSLEKDFSKGWTPALGSQEVSQFKFSFSEDREAVEAEFLSESMFRGLKCSKGVRLYASKDVDSFLVTMDKKKGEIFCDYKEFRFYGESKFKKDMSPIFLEIGAGTYPLGRKYKLGEISVQGAQVSFGREKDAKKRLKQVSLDKYKFFVLGSFKGGDDSLTAIFREPLEIFGNRFPPGTTVLVEDLRDGTGGAEITHIGLPEGESATVEGMSCKGSVSYRMGKPFMCGTKPFPGVDPKQIEREGM